MARSAFITRTSSGDALLNLGCGKHFSEEWTNLDLNARSPAIAHDLRRPLPFPDQSFDAAYTSHLLEHLDPADGEQLVAEIARVLKPGATFRVVVPDLEGICREYLARLEEAADSPERENLQRYRWTMLELIDQMVRERPGGRMAEAVRSGDVDADYVLTRHGDEFASLVHAGEPAQVSEPGRRSPGERARGAAVRVRDAIFKNRLSPRRTGEAHRWMYDRLSLRLLLEDEGFEGFHQVDFDRSAIPDWDRYRLDASSRGPGPRKPDSIYVEARKRGA